MQLSAHRGETTRPRLAKAERREQILLELRLRPHVGIAELAARFGVSSETIRRDFEELSQHGLLCRSHGGASAAPQGRYPDFDERNQNRLEERERIGRRAAELVQPGDVVMIDSGSTTLQAARFIAHRDVSCTVITNSLPVTMALGQSAAVRVIVAPGDYDPAEAAVTGTETVDFLKRHRAGRCMIGATALAVDGVFETVRGFAAVKRAMLSVSRESHLLVDSAKFDRHGMARVAAPEEIGSVVTDRAPAGALSAILQRRGVAITRAT
ncbi:DeoR/GlpR family transcriptional regulator of sugar metabolism [Rhodovulum iodosum]|uniref:DeoR/GlpR family transcriptional regulator of sugar metabolism n=1 Tax=Rhodovulum iodosum TaxID=68291 RepID=A0ABV3XXA4_9RHOB|nr:DeoR/GlpR family DNA-binding transcription regulator [Rhodovulum robiginosum]RSK37790.1 DeoR/GlpR transcriptional regulator [Rhodovulum robiginosum]